MNKTELTQRLYEADLIDNYAITGSLESYLFMTNQNGEGYYWINHKGETLGFIKEDLDKIYSEAKEYGLSDKKFHVVSNCMVYEKQCSTIMINF
ncbi:hypothetical protein CD538_23080 [Salmonella enterica subsp. enterica serovar Bareilly]|nr:hypothetical protein [Salmonella enterica subsp. enterica serovar Bareilly]EDI4164904.1 hypothetical protein [Salmonella enterica subsp. enterica serovar Bareilly]